MCIVTGNLVLQKSWSGGLKFLESEREKLVHTYISVRPAKCFIRPITDSASISRENYLDLGTKCVI